MPEECDIVIKRGYVSPSGEEKGMGSAFGGEWRPKKEEDKRFLGEPGEIKTTIMKNGERYDTKIGPDGKAVLERHYTDHDQDWAHTNPHDHRINWERPKVGFPNYEKPHINYHEDIPEFKNRKGVFFMTNTIHIDDFGSRFESISDFEDCMIRGGEVLFKWNDKTYSITHYNGRIAISESHKQETEKTYLTAKEALTYKIDNISLGEIIKQVEVICRTI